MILHKHKAIFVHVPKTGGTSIENFFGIRWDPVISKINDYSTMTGGFLVHCFYDKILEHHPHAFDYFSFGFTRNPWARAFSHYRWFRRCFSGKFTKLSFKEFLILISNPDFEYKHHVRPQTDFLLDDAGNKIIDFIGRFESIQDDFTYVCNKLGLKDSKLPHVNKARTQIDYRNFYNEDLKEIVSEKYAKDIEYFNYEFGE